MPPVCIAGFGSRHNLLGGARTARGWYGAAGALWDFLSLIVAIVLIVSILGMLGVLASAPDD